MKSDIPWVERIRELRTEAELAGDYTWMYLCDEALSGNKAATERCLHVLACADAMLDRGEDDES